MRKILLILCIVFFAMVFISCNNEDKNIPSKPTETDWEEIEESCTETISGVEEFDFSVGEWEYYQYVEQDVIWKDGKEAKLIEICTENLLIEETEYGKKVYASNYKLEIKHTFSHKEDYEEEKKYLSEKYEPDRGYLEKIEFIDETNTIIMVESDTSIVDESSFSDFIYNLFDFTEYKTNEEKTILMLKDYGDFKTEDGRHFSGYSKEFYVKK